MFFLLFFLPPSIFSRNLYVPREYKTIQAALDASKSSDTIWIAPGKYVENLIILKDIVIFGAGADKCIIAPSPKTSFPTVYIRKSNVIINGLTIDGSMKGSVGSVVIDGGSPHLSGMIIKNSSSNGIILMGKSIDQFPIFKDNKIFGNKKIGISVQKANLLIENNEIYNNNSAGISCIESIARIENNKIHDNNGVGVLFRQPYPNSKKLDMEGNQIRITNNEIILNKMGGILCDRVDSFIAGNKITMKTGKPNVLLLGSNSIVEKNILKSSGPPAIIILAGSFPKIIANNIYGTLRFAIMGEQQNALIKDNKIVSSWKSKIDLQPRN